MSVSSIAPGSTAAQDGARSAGAQRMESPQPGQVRELPAQGDLMAVEKTAEKTVDSSADAQARTSSFVPTPHANRVGVAAYVAVMNPAPPVTVRTEA